MLLSCMCFVHHKCIYVTSCALELPWLARSSQPCHSFITCHSQDNFETFRPVALKKRLDYKVPRLRDV
eukprot:4944578-Amphidinium_carterae.1